jgi:hypothetical protein
MRRGKEGKRKERRGKNKRDEQKEEEKRYEGKRRNDKWNTGRKGGEIEKTEIKEVGDGKVKG